MDNKIAVIDLGTNTFHLLIAEWDGRRYNIVRRERNAARIGVGGINRDVLTGEGIERALIALKEFKAIADEETVDNIYALGTSAFRNARNGKAVAQQIKDETGITITIISGDEEAQYIYLGVRDAIAMGNESSLIIDIGGGSVEFIIGNNKQILWKRSYEIGGQRLLELFHRHDPILPEEIDRLNAYLLNALPTLLEQLRNFQPTLLLGSSGTFDTLSDMYSSRKSLPLLPAAETPLTFESFNESFELLVKRNREERLALPGMIEMRVEMIVVACCLVRFLLDHHTFRDIRVSSYSLKEGVLASLSQEARG